MSGQRQSIRPLGCQRERKVDATAPARCWFGVRGSRLRAEGVGCGVWGVGCGVWGVGLRVVDVGAAPCVKAETLNPKT